MRGGGGGEGKGSLLSPESLLGYDDSMIYSRWQVMYQSEINRDRAIFCYRGQPYLTSLMLMSIVRFPTML